MKQVKIVSVKAVREATLTTYSKNISCASDAARILVEHGMAEEAQETFVILCLNVKGDVIALNEVSRGDLSTTPVHPREVFKVAMLCNAASLIVAHNHPSGDTTPSQADVEITKRLMKCGELMGIKVLDHIIVGAFGDSFTSLLSDGYMGE